MKPDARSDLEKLFFDQGSDCMTRESLCKLIHILSAERNAFRDNWIATDKARMLAERQLENFQQRKPWRILRSLFRLATKQDLREMEQRILMTQKELQAALDTATAGIGSVSAQLTKATGEITAEIQTLKDAIAAGPVSDAVATSLANLQAKIAPLQALSQALDDLNPDQPPTP